MLDPRQYRRGDVLEEITQAFLVAITIHPRPAEMSQGDYVTNVLVGALEAAEQQVRDHEASTRQPKPELDAFGAPIEVAARRDGLQARYGWREGSERFNRGEGLEGGEDD